MAIINIELDAEHEQRLAEISQTRGTTEDAILIELIDSSIGDLIDRAYSDIERQRRLQLVSTISQMQIEDLPDPEAMSQQLAEAHGRADLR